jgi:hypothetical protein
VLALAVLDESVDDEAECGTPGQPVEGTEGGGGFGAAEDSAAAADTDEAGGLGGVGDGNESGKPAAFSNTAASGNGVTNQKIIVTLSAPRTAQRLWRFG